MVEENRSHINQRHDLVEVLFLVLTAVQQLITMLNIEGALLTNDGRYANPAARVRVTRQRT
ncbi:MAG: hypothetical protein ACRC1W_06710 [Shewanella sp.]